MDGASKYSNARVPGKDILDGNMGLEDFGENVSSFGVFELV